MHAIYKIPYNENHRFNLCQQFQEQQLIQNDNLIEVSKYSPMLQKNSLNYNSFSGFLQLKKYPNLIHTSGFNIPDFLVHNLLTPQAAI